MEVAMRDVIRYSESFKLQVVREIESGKHPTCGAARNAYGIRGCDTVACWVRKYGKNHLLGRVVRVETVDERIELKRLKQEVRKLKEALADTTVELSLERAYVKIACKAAGIADVEGFKKKVVSNPSMARLAPDGRGTV
jgi:transposase-like protein